jgi:hypothetical protein
MNALFIYSTLAAAANTVFVINTTMFLKWRENGAACVVLSHLPFFPITLF